MPYPRKLLSPNEVVKVDLKPHPLYFLGPAVSVIAALIVAILFVAWWDVSILSWFSTLAIIVAAAWLLGRFIRWRSTYFVVTDDKVIYRSGVFKKTGVQIPLERVNSVNFDQNFFEQILGAGDLAIESGGMGGPAKFTDVRHPEKVQVLIHDAIEENATGVNPYAADMPRRMAPPPGAAPEHSSPLPPPPPVDVTTQLEKLEGLYQRGSITKDEFEAQKRRLLGGVVRVVSLVPSVTETLLAWGIEPVAVTRFCEQPHLRAVGGTKDPDVAAIVALAPDLVVVNDEENRREDADALIAAGLALHVTHVHTVADVAPTLTALAAAVGAPSPSVNHRIGTDSVVERRTAFVPIWRRPWMTFNDDTYGASVLQVLGVANVFGAQPERYPTTTLEEAAARTPDLVLAPTEPYPFAERHLPELRQVAADARLVDGQDLFWWGSRTPAALERLAQALGE